MERDLRPLPTELPDKLLAPQTPKDQTCFLAIFHNIGQWPITPLPAIDKIINGLDYGRQGSVCKVNTENFESVIGAAPDVSHDTIRNGFFCNVHVSVSLLGRTCCRPTASGI